MTTVRTVLALAASKQWPLFQLDAPRQWFSKFADALSSYGFLQSPNDHSLFTFDHNGDFLILLVYVDDVVLTGTSTSQIDKVKAYIHAEFQIKDLGYLKYFLGIEVARSSSGIFINQRQYVLDLLSEVGLLACKPSSTPMDIKQKLALSTANPLPDPTEYRKIVGKLVYLHVTRPDIAFPVHMLSQFLAAPTTEHLQAATRVLRFLKNAPAQGLFYPAGAPLSLEAFCDADWASCPLTRRSTSGYGIKLGNCLVSWRTKKQSLFHDPPPNQSTERWLMYAVNLSGLLPFLRTFTYQSRGQSSSSVITWQPTT
ncbi:unnamed protein product [Rhodiola kirilowii]